MSSFYVATIKKHKIKIHGQNTHTHTHTYTRAPPLTASAATKPVDGRQDTKKHVVYINGIVLLTKLNVNGGKQD